MPTLDLPSDLEFELRGAGDRAVVGSTVMPSSPPRAVALTLHGWTGHQHRNIVPLAAAMLRDLGCISHRITLGHSGVEPGADDVTDLDAFERDSLDNATRDVAATLEMIDRGDLPGEELPLILLGHSRGGAQIIRIAATAARDRWELPPIGVIALAPVAFHGFLHPKEREHLERDGFVERPCTRSPTGRVRMGRSWFQHWLDEPDRDHMSEDVRDAECPLLIAHGEADTSVGLDHAERLERLAHEHDKRNWRFVRVPGADHNFSAKGFLPAGLEYSETIIDTLRAAVEDFIDHALSPRV